MLPIFSKLVRNPLTRSAMTAPSTLSILFKSEDYVVIDKQMTGDFPVTVEKLLAAEFPNQPKFFWVHQLDYATSGVLCVALHQKAAAQACRVFATRLAFKSYIALVNGHVCPEDLLRKGLVSTIPNEASSKFCISHPIRPCTPEEDPRQFRMALGQGPFCKDSTTFVEVVKQGFLSLDDLSELPTSAYFLKETGRHHVTLLRLFPQTGRKHQLRLHCNFIGHPIVGDYTYERPHHDTFRMFLHAECLRLPFSEIPAKYYSRQGPPPDMMLASEVPWNFPEFT
eukprot:Sdes_comp20332_c0_seq1m14056